MKPCVFIQANDQQMVGALVSAFSLRRNSQQPEAFDVRILRQEDFPFFAAHEGQAFWRGDRKHNKWLNGFTQAFTPLRFMPPELMGYQGRAVVIDPDIFAVGDVNELLSRDMHGKAILCRWIADEHGGGGYFASSVMLLDCARLRHWRCEAHFDELFAFKRDYTKWMSLELEPRETIGPLEEEWNHFDSLTEKTKLLHNTNRSTQPWRTGLPVDYDMRKPWLRRVRDRILGRPPGSRTYERHPDPNQERLFFALLRQAVDDGAIAESFLRREIGLGRLRPDALDMIGRTEVKAAVAVAA
jgi:hypothetical protein